MSGLRALAGVWTDLVKGTDSKVRDVEVNDQNHFDPCWMVFPLGVIPCHNAKGNSSTFVHPLLHCDLSL